MMANSSRARRYGSAGASVLLAASLSLCALPSVAAANTPNPVNPPVITVYNYKVETNTRELKTAALAVGAAVSPPDPVAVS